MNSRSAFGGGDQAYLRNEQYRHGTKLDARTSLHRRFSTATEAFPDFASGLIDWSGVETVLECGCGTGRLWENHQAPKTIELTLTDLSPAMVEAAVDHARGHGFTNVNGSEQDVQRLPFDDDSYDLVVANHMLYHVPDPDQAVAELARVLRPGGTLQASTNARGHMCEMTESISDVFVQVDTDLYDVFGLESGEVRLREQFATVSWHAYDNHLLVTDLEAAVAYAISFPPGETATDSQRDALGIALERRCEDGVLRIQTRTGAFICQGPRHKNTA